MHATRKSSLLLLLLLLLAASAPARAENHPPAAAGTTFGGADVTLGAFAWRKIGDPNPAWNRGLELAWGPTVAADQGPFHFMGLVQVDVRAFAASSWALALSTNAFEVAAPLGPLEPQMRVGVAVASVDDFAGNLSAELFSPRVGVGLGLRAGHRVRITLGAYAEYFWRWFGPSDLVRGLTLDVLFEKPRRSRGRQ